MAEMNSDEVREIRTLLGMTQKELAAKLGYNTHLTVWRWENGEANAPGPAVRLLRIWRQEILDRQATK